MGLGAKVVHLVGFDLAQQAGEVGGIGQIAVVQLEAGIVDMGILIDVIHTRRIERRRPPLDPMHLIAFGQKKLCKVGTILAGHTGDEGFFHLLSLSLGRSVASLHLIQPPAAHQKGPQARDERSLGHVAPKWQSVFRLCPPARGTVTGTRGDRRGENPPPERKRAQLSRKARFK